MKTCTMGRIAVLKERVTVLAVLFACFASAVQAANPVVSNVRAKQRDGTKLVEIRYDLSDPDSSYVAITVGVSTNGDTISDLFANTFEVGSAVGIDVTPGREKLIVWNAGADWNGKFSQQIRFLITANDTLPSGMVVIPSGSFTMGDSFGEGASDQLPTHSVYVSGFYMGKYEVSKALWDEVHSWAISNGYSFDNVGSGKATSHPVHTVNWYDIVKWCNARSEKEGRTPAYYTSSARTTVYRIGQVGVENDWVEWDAGYRLPTEAEWEKAARGGTSGSRFPWSDSNNISHSRANYYAGASYAYDLSYPEGVHPTYATGGLPYTSPVGSFGANGYGLYDMAGNVQERCWDWWGYDYYSSSPSTDPRGPSFSYPFRVCRGNSWGEDASGGRVAQRTSTYAPDYVDDRLGFRTVLPPGQ